MTAFTVVSVVDKGDFKVVGILEGAYGLNGAPEGIDGDLFAHIIDAESWEAAEQIVTERYMPQPTTGPLEDETPC